jgi:dihydrofolate reductase
LPAARVCAQYLAEGLVDEMKINLAPTLLGSGERLFGGVDDRMGSSSCALFATPKVSTSSSRARWP